MDTYASICNNVSAMPHFVYIARCSDDSLYTGTCIDLKAREAKHNAGEGAKYTRSRLPVRFVYYEQHKNLSESRSREAEIKRMTRQEKVELLSSRATIRS